MQFGCASSRKSLAEWYPSPGSAHFSPSSVVDLRRAHSCLVGDGVITAPLLASVERDSRSVKSRSEPLPHPVPAVALDHPKANLAILQLPHIHLPLCQPSVRQIELLIH